MYVISLSCFVLSGFSEDERSYLASDGYKCTMVLVFYSTSCEDWTAEEDSLQEGFTELTTPHFA